MHLLVPGGRRLTSLGVLSPARRSSVEGPEEYCPRSGEVPLQVRRSTVPGPQNGAGPGTGKWPAERIASQVPGKSADRGRNGRGPGTQRPRTGNGKLGDRGRKCRTGGLWRCRSGGVLSPVREMGRDRGRESGLQSVWRRRSRGKVRTGDATTEDQRHKAPGPATQRPRTGNATAEDREHNGRGPATQSPQPGDRTKKPAPRRDRLIKQ